MLVVQSDDCFELPPLLARSVSLPKATNPVLGQHPHSAVTILKRATKRGVRAVITDQAQSQNRGTPGHPIARDGQPLRVPAA